jgi:hypothetical protein
MAPCLPLVGFGATFLGMAVLPWRWFYVLQLAEEPAALGRLPLPLRILSRVAAFVVAVAVLGYAATQCL